MLITRPQKRRIAVSALTALGGLALCLVLAPRHVYWLIPGGVLCMNSAAYLVWQLYRAHCLAQLFRAYDVTCTPFVENQIEVKGTKEVVLAGKQILLERRMFISNAEALELDGRTGRKARGEQS